MISWAFITFAMENPPLQNIDGDASSAPLKGFPPAHERKVDPVSFDGAAHVSRDRFPIAHDIELGSHGDDIRIGGHNPLAQDAPVEVILPTPGS